jgi:hypothetical protein
MSVQLAGRLLLALATVGAGSPFAFADEPKKEQPDEPKVVKLTAPAIRPVVAGDGRFLVMHLPQAKQIAVFDAQEKKIVQNLESTDTPLVLAAGRDHFFALDSAASTLQRWSFAKFEKEATVRTPDGGPFASVCIGANSVGPLLLFPKVDTLGRASPKFVHPITLKEVPVKDGPLPGGHPGTARASTDGQTFCWQEDGFRSTTVATVTEGKLVAKTLRKQSIGPTPGPGGRYFYATDGVFNSEMIRVVPEGFSYPLDVAFVQSTHGDLFLQVTPPGGPRFPKDPNPRPEGPGKAQVYLQGETKPVGTIEGLKGLSVASDRVIFFLPEHQLLILLGRELDELVLYPFDPDAMLGKSAANFLLVTTEPPAQVTAGTKFEYTPGVKSRRGGVKVTLDYGPEGMTLGADGKLAWDVPAALTNQEVKVILTVSDATGQEIFHTFRLKVAAPQGAAPPLPSKP